jgi:hypothetical protein
MFAGELPGNSHGEAGLAAVAIHQICCPPGGAPWGSA